MKNVPDHTTRSERRYRALLAATGSLVWIMDHRGAVNEPQLSWEQYTGQSYDQYRGFGWVSAVHHEDRAEIRRVWRKARRGCEVQRLRARLWHEPSREYRHVKAKIVPVPDPDGAIREWVSTCRDIEDQRLTEQALLESEAHFRALYEQAAVGIEQVGLDGKLLGGNSMLCRLLGYSDEELKQRTFAQITHPDDLARELALLEQLVAGEINSYTLEKRYLHKDGRPVWVRVSSSLVRSEKSSTRMRLSVIEDIADTHQATDELARSKGRFEAIFNSISDAVMLADAQLRIVLANPAFTRVFGYSAREVAGQTTEILYPTHEAFVEHGRLRYNSAGEAVSQTFEIEYRRKDGSLLWCESCLVPVRNPNGTLMGFMGIHRDITHRKGFEEALRDSQVRLRQSEAMARHHLSELQNIYKSAPIGLCVFDTELRFVRINDLMAEMNGIPANEHIGKSMYELVPDVAAKVEPVFRRIIATRTPVLDMELSGTTRAQPGVVRHWLESYLPIIDENFDVIGINVTSVEITDRKRVEQERQMLLEAERAARAEAERLNRIKDEFLATVSHELRTPLNAIVGWARLLARGKVNDPKALDIIDRNASSLTQIVEDLLDTSRIITGRVHLEREVVHLAQVVRETLEGVQLAAQAKSIYLNASYDPDLRPLSCDPGRIRQIVWNLLTNAIKFTPVGGQVSLALSQDAGGVEITVSDTGQGIDPEFLPQMFTRFRQADASTTRKHGGLGLGLAITRHLVELHGGTICAESKGVGKGAVFRVYLPGGDAGAIAGEHRPAKAPSQADCSPDLLRGRRIVVVDDDLESSDLVTRILSDYGATVQNANSTEEAFRLLAERTPDLLISDISMPDEDGYSFVRRIRSCESGSEPLACIAITALARPEDKTKALKAGYDEHLAKPFDAAELVCAVTRLIKHSCQDTTPVQDLSSLGQPVTNGQGPRANILVVEDDETIVELLKVSLEAHGYQVSTAGSVASAVSLAQSWPVDVVVSDLQLEDGTGWDLMSRLREIRPVAGIVLSGYSGSTYKQRSTAAGFSEYLVKPVDDQQLLQSIDRLVGQIGVEVPN